MSTATKNIIAITSAAVLAQKKGPKLELKASEKLGPNDDVAIKIIGGMNVSDTAMLIGLVHLTSWADVVGGGRPK